ncbi:MAG TPA: hypothetical protein VMH04_12465 [Candidatus Solibacter sp.]|nr:hypothetical protein [Candidatus Solibacter sp.]
MSKHATSNVMRTSYLLVLSAMLLTAVIPSPAQQETVHRLILKDGSYQLVTKYEVKGDRVHYYSSEREDWEDVPNSLVDWPATEKFEKDRTAAAASPEAVELDKELEHERELEEQQQPQVAPGLRIPENSGVFLLDNFQGEPQLDEIQQTAGDLNRNTKGNIFRGALNPIASAKQTIELDGSHAPIQSHVAVPSLYINVDEGPNASNTPTASNIQLDTALPDQKKPKETQERQQPEQPQQASVPFDRFRIIHTEVKGNKRIVGDVKRAVTGKVSQDQKFIKTTITKVTGGWFKVTPSEPLAAGEYALVEMMGKEGMNLYVWDFGVNPRAAANANPWKPDAKEAHPSAVPANR